MSSRRRPDRNRGTRRTAPGCAAAGGGTARTGFPRAVPGAAATGRSEEHTSELQSQSNLVCRLLLEKKKQHQQPRVSSIYTDNSPYTAPALARDESS